MVSVNYKDEDLKNRNWYRPNAVRYEYGEWTDYGSYRQRRRIYFYNANDMRESQVWDYRQKPGAPGYEEPKPDPEPGPSNLGSIANPLTGSFYLEGQKFDYTYVIKIVPSEEAGYPYDIYQAFVTFDKRMFMTPYYKENKNWSSRITSVLEDEAQELLDKKDEKTTPGDLFEGEISEFREEIIETLDVWERARTEQFEELAEELLEDIHDQYAVLDQWNEAVLEDEFNMLGSAIMRSVDPVLLEMEDIQEELKGLRKVSDEIKTYGTTLSTEAWNEIESKLSEAPILYKIFSGVNYAISEIELDAKRQKDLFEDLNRIYSIIAVQNQAQYDLHAQFSKKVDSILEHAKRVETDEGPIDYSAITGILSRFFDSFWKEAELTKGAGEEEDVYYMVKAIYESETQDTMNYTKLYEATQRIRQDLEDFITGAGIGWDIAWDMGLVHASIYSLLTNINRTTETQFSKLPIEWHDMTKRQREDFIRLNMEQLDQLQRVEPYGYQVSPTGSAPWTWGQQWAGRIGSTKLLGTLTGQYGGETSTRLFRKIRSDGDINWYRESKALLYFILKQTPLKYWKFRSKNYKQNFFDMLNWCTQNGYLEGWQLENGETVR